MIPKEVTNLAKLYGAKLIRTSKHAVWRLPNGAQVYTAQSPSDHRALANIKRQFKKASRI